MPAQRGKRASLPRRSPLDEFEKLLEQAWKNVQKHIERQQPKKSTSKRKSPRAAA